MKLRNTFPSVALAFVALIGLSACTVSAADAPANENSSSADTSGPIILGLATSGSGWMTASDEGGSNAVYLAVDDINAAGGINGRMLEVRYEDTKTDQTYAATAAQNLIAQGAHVILASTDFDYGSPSAFAAAAENTVAISIGAASPKFGAQNIGPLAFTMGSVTPSTATAGAQFAYDSLDARNAAVLCDTSIEYSKALCDSFKIAWADAGGTIAGEANFQNSDASIAQQISSLAASNADVIYLGSYNPGAAAAVRQLRAAGISTPIVSGEATSDSTWLKTVEGLNDFYAATYANVVSDEGNNPEAVEVLANYTARYGAPKNSNALVGYATVQMLAAALKSNGGDTSGPALAQALMTVKDVPTVLGPTTFPEPYHFAVERQITIMAVEDGAWVFKEKVTPKNVVIP